jgi:hypothetical protein
MRRKILPLLVAVVLLITSIILYRRRAACKERDAAYHARVERLERDAHEKLKIGTKRDAVASFFAENGIPVTFSADEASGTVYTSGCAPKGCGTDAALLGLRVKVDDAGTVVSEPVVGALYSDCL